MSDERGPLVVNANPNPARCGNGFFTPSMSTLYKAANLGFSGFSFVVGVWALAAGIDSGRTQVLMGVMTVLTGMGVAASGLELAGHCRRSENTR